MKTLFLIDANSLIHRAFHALPNFTAPDGTPTGALYGISTILLKIIREKKPDYIAAAFDRPEETFREKEYAEYKGTRAKTEDELVSQIIESRKLIEILGIKTFELAGFEADDILLTLAKRYEKEKDLKIVIFSGDLDLLQAVKDDKILVETPHKGISNTTTYNEKAVIERFAVSPKLFADYKGLVGDKSDNIPGVSGIGPKTAANIINKYGDLDYLYKEIEEMGLPDIKLQKKLEENKDSAFLSKRLATLEGNVQIEPIPLETLKATNVNLEKVIPYFRELGFRGLINKLEE